ncbi:MAG TPA: hypothetical protein VK578_01505 [Edaphobacter sp.]|nr:hypothetical protein [Edaphobacter sp.]
MKAHLWVLLVPLVTVTCAQSVPSFPASFPTMPSHRLAGAKIFALWPVGYALETSQEEHQFKAIFVLDRGKAKQELELLYSSRNPQAMSYALVGMRKLDQNRYAELLAEARVSELEVTTMSGCVGETKTLRTVASELDAGKYDRWLRWMPSF